MITFDKAVKRFENFDDVMDFSITIVDVEILFFFFQAEDGIRDLTVTGVQTCALPILFSIERTEFGRSCIVTATSTMPGGPTMPALSNSEGTAASFFAVVANGLRRPMRVTLLLTLMFAFAAVRAFAQGKNPYAGDAKIAKLGEYQFRLNCAFGHGLGARGGGRGPDLTRAQKRHGNSDAEMFHNIHDGISGTAMHAATNGGIGVGMSDEEIWQVGTYLRSVPVKAPEQPAGNPEHGKELFNGGFRFVHCSGVD